MSYLRRYVSQFSSLECAESFHVFSWLSVVSCCMGRRCWIDRGFFTTYPNIYVVLIGEAGSGKSVAMYQARDLLDELNKQLSKEERIVLAPKCSSARKFMEIVAQQQQIFRWNDQTYSHAPLACFLSEFINFIQLDPNFIMQFLTDAYDDKYFDYETQHKGGFRIDGPAPVILACTTHKQITKKMREDIVSDGAARRIFWLLDERKTVRNPDPQKPALDQKLVEKLKVIRKMTGPFIWHPEGKEFYDAWYMDNNQENFGMDGYGTTKNVKVEKIVMLLAASERSEMVVRRRDVEQALELCALMEKNLTQEQLFRGIELLNKHEIFSKIL